MIGVLRNRTFRHLFSAQVVALVGTGILTVGLGLLAFDLAGSDAGAVLGTALAIKMVAYVVVAPVVSALTCRVPRKTLLVGADVVRALIAVGLPFVTEIWMIYLLVFALQAASATFTPAFQSVIPSVLTADGDYNHGLSLSRLAYDLEAVLSPVLAAALLTVVGYNVLFVGTVVGFVLSALLVVTAVLPQLPVPSADMTRRRRITLGACELIANEGLRGLLVLNVVVAAGTALVMVNTVVYVREFLGGADVMVAAALGCFGAGSMVTALTLPRLLRAVAVRTVMLGGAVVTSAGLAGVSALLMIGSGRPELLMATWVVLGLGGCLITTPSARLIVDASRPTRRSAAFAAQFSLSHACFLVTYPIAGWVGAVVGHVEAATILATLAILATAAAACIWPTRVPSDPALTPV
ncbi:MFS transporter [Williamsia sp. 1135]|uniref:MFS transporter n=1 Tax=Williamsia sp. 1135 TaxID=1889262 RepID=UPI000A118084|nr:MFS transporter [Williamsia sp. 1135]ORM37643.1 MFS transporter [Williamsia sp. 1135]